MREILVARRGDFLEAPQPLMQNLRDQLLKAGLVTQEQAERAALDKTRGRGPRRGPPRDAGRPVGSAGSGGSVGSVGSASRGEARTPPRDGAGRPRQPVNRLVDLSDPARLAVFQAIERHRVRSETQGDLAFHFTLRDGRVRKMFVSDEISRGLESGALAIVENGSDDEHIVVHREAVDAILIVDREVIRFHNMC